MKKLTVLALVVALIAPTFTLLHSPTDIPHRCPYRFPVKFWRQYTDLFEYFDPQHGGGPAILSISVKVIDRESMWKRLEEIGKKRMKVKPIYKTITIMQGHNMRNEYFSILWLGNRFVQGKELKPNSIQEVWVCLEYGPFIP